MPQLFLQNSRRRWTVARLEEETYFFTRDLDRPIRSTNGEDGSLPLRLLRRGSRDGPGETWVVVARATTPLRVNGSLVASGVRVLRDRDVLILPGLGRVFYSAERLPEIAPHRGAATRCARCTQPIDEGTPSVRCPGCGRSFHEDPERRLACWTYAARCNHCGHPTDLDAGLRWTPEDL